MLQISLVSVDSTVCKDEESRATTKAHMRKLEYGQSNELISSWQLTLISLKTNHAQNPSLHWKGLVLEARLRKAVLEELC